MISHWSTGIAWFLFKFVKLGPLHFDLAFSLQLCDRIKHCFDLLSGHEALVWVSYFLACLSLFIKNCLQLDCGENLVESFTVKLVTHSPIVLSGNVSTRQWQEFCFRFMTSSVCLGNFPCPNHVHSSVLWINGLQPWLLNLHKSVDTFPMTLISSSHLLMDTDSVLVLCFFLWFFMKAAFMDSG